MQKTISLWWVTKDGDRDCYELFERHYSSRKNKSRKQRLFVGPGEKLVLRTLEGDAVFAWRVSRYRHDDQYGVECTIFRNEGRSSSLELLRQADRIADQFWPGERHYTFVDASAVRSTNPGYVFLLAGWEKCGITKKGLIIMEKLPLDDRLEIARYEAFRRVRHVRDMVCKDREGKKLLTRIMRRLKK